MSKAFFSPGEPLLQGSWESDLLQKLEKLIHLSHSAVITQVNDVIQSDGPTGTACDLCPMCVRELVVKKSHLNSSFCSLAEASAPD